MTTLKQIEANRHNAISVHVRENATFNSLARRSRSSTDCFKVFNALAAPNAIEDPGLFRAQVREYDHGDRFADRFLFGVAERALGARIPALHDAVEVLADDRIVGGFDDAGEPLLGALSLPVLAHVQD
jgi:hypothetical protein